MPRKPRVIYRQCQECRAVHQASEFKRASKSAIMGPERKVRCPACRYEAPLWAFLLVEPPVESEQPEGEN